MHPLSLEGQVQGDIMQYSTLVIEGIRFISIGFGFASAIFWACAASIKLPEKVAATWNGGGPIQEMADALQKQIKFNARAAMCAALAVALQAILLTIWSG